MNRLFLNALIVATAIAVGILHYKLKPAPDEQQLNQYAQSMTSSIEWQGRIAPDFELKTTRGEQFRLSDRVGEKVIVLNFFATWCGPCRAEMPELKRYFDAHKADAFLLAIDAEEKTERVDEFLLDLKLDFPAGIDEGPIRKQYGVTSFPTTVLIGVDGKVQFYEVGALANAEVAFDRLLEQNNQLLKAGRVISPEDYRLAAQKQPALTTHEVQQNTSKEDADKLDARGKRIVARMDCPCGCDKKVQVCTCNTSNKIKKALVSEDFQSQPDDQIIKGLNKKFCSEGM